MEFKFYEMDPWLLRKWGRIVKHLKSFVLGNFHLFSYICWILIVQKWERVEPGMSFKINITSCNTEVDITLVYYLVLWLDSVQWFSIYSVLWFYLFGRSVSVVWPCLRTMGWTPRFCNGSTHVKICPLNHGAPPPKKKMI